MALIIQALFPKLVFTISLSRGLPIMKSIPQKNQNQINHSITTNSSNMPVEHLESLQKKVSIPSKWGFGERLVPEFMANDPASQKITKIHLQHYEIAARYVPQRRVLDIACGAGYGSQILHIAGASKVVGVDVSPDTIQYAQQHYSASGIEFVCSDAEQFEYSEPFDVIVSFETLEHLRYPEKFLERIRSYLAPKGEFLLSVPLGETRHFDPYHLHKYTQGEIFALLEKAGFLINLYRCDDLFLSRSDLKHWEKLYPEAPQPSAYELLFTNRGRRVMYDLIFRGGFKFQQLLVSTSVADNSVNS